MSFADRKQILRSLTPRRLANYAALKSSYYLARMTKKPAVWGKPYSISIEPTTSCNLRCPECPSGLRQFSRQTGNMPLDYGKRIIDQVHKHVGYINFYFQGEPMISPHIYDLISYARDKGIYTATSTNAHFLTPENSEKLVSSGLNRLIVSIDGATQETYEQYRKEGSLQKAIEGTRNLIRAKKDRKGPHVILQFLVVRPNEHEIPQILELGQELGVDEIKFKTAQLYDYENGHPLMPENLDYARYVLGRDGKFKVKGEPGNHCWRMWQGCVFTWDGIVVPCCFDKDAKHQMGNALEQDFKTIWRSAGYNKFRRMVLRSRNEIDICENCSEGTQVWA